jgi:hypothetical protein
MSEDKTFCIVSATGFHLGTDSSSMVTRASAILNGSYTFKAVEYKRNDEGFCIETGFSLFLEFSYDRPGTPTSQPRWKIMGRNTQTDDWGFNTFLALQLSLDHIAHSRIEAAPLPFADDRPYALAKQVIHELNQGLISEWAKEFLTPMYLEPLLLWARHLNRMDKWDLYSRRVALIMLLSGTVNLANLGGAGGKRRYIADKRRLLSMNLSKIVSYL